MSARALVTLLRDPVRAADVQDWAGVLTAARAESLLATLAHRLPSMPNSKNCTASSGLKRSATRPSR